MLQADALHRLWSTPVGVHRFDRAADVNDTLVRVPAQAVHDELHQALPL